MPANIIAVVLGCRLGVENDLTKVTRVSVGVIVEIRCRKAVACKSSSVKGGGK